MDSSDSKALDAGRLSLSDGMKRLFDLPEDTTGVVCLLLLDDGGFASTSRRCHSALEAACTRHARGRYPEWVIQRGVAGGVAKTPAAVTTAFLAMRLARKELKRLSHYAANERGTLKIQFDQSAEHARDLLADVGYVYRRWRELVIDDAKTIGLWCLDVEGISRPMSNPLSISGGYEGRILRIAFDNITGELSAVVEAHGEGDLQEAHSSVLVLNDGTKIGPYKNTGHVPLRGVQLSGLHVKYIVRSKRHHICRMNFPRRRNHEDAMYEEVLWDSSNTLSFQYGALEPHESQDYQICEFLRKDSEITWSSVPRPGPAPPRSVAPAVHGAPARVSEG